MKCQILDQLKIKAKNRRMKKLQKWQKKKVIENGMKKKTKTA